MVEKYVSMRRIEDVGKSNSNLNFSEKEIKDLVKAWIIISLAFAVVLSGFESISDFMQMFFISALTVGTGFLLHVIIRLYLRCSRSCHD